MGNLTGVQQRCNGCCEWPDYFQGSAFYVIKTNANTIDTSKAYKMRPLGEMVSDKPFFFYPPQTRTPTGKIPVDVSNITLEAVSEEWISMDIILVWRYEYSNGIIYNAIDSGAKGLGIVAWVSLEKLGRTLPLGILEIASHFDRLLELAMGFNYAISRTWWKDSDFPLSDIVITYLGTNLGSGYLNLQKSRILLGLLLAKGHNMTGNESYFLRSTVG